MDYWKEMAWCGVVWYLGRAEESGGIAGWLVRWWGGMAPSSGVMRGWMLRVRHARGGLGIVSILTECGCCKGHGYVDVGVVATSSASSLAALGLPESSGASWRELGLVLGTDSLCGEGPSLGIRDGVGAVDLLLGVRLRSGVRTRGGVE